MFLPIAVLMILSIFVEDDDQRANKEYRGNLYT